jgi:DNA repair protein RecO (recombination protein O)
MRSSRLYRTDAIVLRHRKIGEADKILTLYTPQSGKFDVIAKGIRRPTSRKAGHLEELSQSSLLLARGRTLDVVTQCELVQGFAALRSDLARLSAGLYLAELVDRFSPEREQNEQLFALLLRSLRALADGRDSWLTLRSFELQLLQQTGFAPQLRLCAACHGVLEPVVNAFSPAAGGAVCVDCRGRETDLRPLSVNALKVLRLLQEQRPGQLSRLRAAQSLSSEIEEHLQRYIRHVLERDVRSRDFLRSVQSDQTTSIEVGVTQEPVVS